MGAIILDNAEIGENSIIAAGSVVLSGTRVEPGSIYAGVPAKRIKDVDPQQTYEMINRIADDYIMYAGWYTSPPAPSPEGEGKTGH
jgi:carbonic anhydrase/acetyltransferase-like protein (isoleucine patch superfamily)